MLMQRTHEEHAGIPSRVSDNKPTAERTAAIQSSLGAYGSGSESESSSGDESESEDKEAARLCNQMRQEKHECEMRTSIMGQEQCARMLACQQNRDISEKIALGLTKPTLSKGSMLDSRLFNRGSLSGSFADDEAYNLCNRPLFHGSTAAAAIYKARGNITEGNLDSFGEGMEEGIGKALDNDRVLVKPKSDLRAPRTRWSEKDQCNSRRMLAMFLAWTNF